MALTPVCRSRGGRAVAWSLLACLAACGTPSSIALPGRAAPVPVPPPGGLLLAGLGRADITPPPGLGLVGTGMEGRRARGYRTRLYARALVLEDGAGERFAIVATDLGLLSAQLQRRAVWIVDSLRGDWLGTDRLIVTGTHTHSGPGNFLDAPAYNIMGSTVMYYDSSFADSLARGVARALIRAIENLQPASAAWGSTPMWGFTRNRSLEAYDSNPGPDRPDFGTPPAGLTDEERAVDPTWLMLRVDYRDTITHTRRPAGAFSVFAMHGTANSDLDDLYDGDIHALLERGLERHIDSANAEMGSPVPQAIHLLSNGTEGDVSPVWPASSRCPPPKLVPVGWRPGPRANQPAPEWLEIRRATAAMCIASARSFVADTARLMTARVASLFDSLGAKLSDDLPIAAAFDVLPLKGALAPIALCDPPAIGQSALGGAPDVRTRLMNWEVFGFVPEFLGMFTQINDGPRAPRRTPEKCQAKKRVALGPIQVFLANLGAIPDFAQFTVVRVGNVVLATAPGEITTVAGETIRREVQRSLAPLHGAIERVGVVGLTNGYLSYVATAWEYKRQRFEGANTFYGPETDSVFARHLGALAARLTDGHENGNLIPDLHVSPGMQKSIVPVHQGPWGPPVTRSISRVECAGGVATVEWIDERPERLLPHDGPLVRIEQLRDGTWTPLTWDDDPWLEVVPLRGHGDGYVWHINWTPHPAPAGPLRVRLDPRGGEPETPISAQVPENCFSPGAGR